MSDILIKVFELLAPPDPQYLSLKYFILTTFIFVLSFLSKQDIVDFLNKQCDISNFAARDSIVTNKLYHTSLQRLNWVWMYLKIFFPNLSGLLWWGRWVYRSFPRCLLPQLWSGMKAEIPIDCETVTFPSRNHDAWLKTSLSHNLGFPYLLYAHAPSLQRYAASINLSNPWTVAWDRTGQGTLAFLWRVCDSGGPTAFSPQLVGALYS